MKKFIGNLFWIVLLSLDLYSQSSKLNGVAVNEFGVGVPFATVINKTSSKGVLCDSLGRFNIDAKIGDSLACSSIGYFKKDYVIQSLISRHEIILLTKVDTLKEVRVTSNQISLIKRFGIPKGAKISKNSYFLPTESFLHAVCFDDNDIKFKKIHSLNIKMGYKGNSKYLPVRINIYTKSNNGFPSTKLGSRDLILNVSKYKWYRLILDDIFIIPENGICIGFEPLNPSTNVEKFNKDNTPILGVYKSKEYQSFSLTNYTKWYKFERGQNTCPAIYIEVH